MKKEKIIKIFGKISEKMIAATIEIFEKIVISLALVIAAFSAFVKFSSENWQLLTNYWVVITALVATAYVAKECRVIILKNELKAKEDELKKAKTASMIAMRDRD